MSDINIGAFSEALNDKTDRDMRNVDNTAGADAVIEYQLPTAENNYTWYRKYASGWVEQGGYVDTTGATYTATFPVEMVDTNYTIQVSSRADRYVVVDPNTALTTTGVTGWIADSRNGRVYWEVKGIAA